MNSVSILSDFHNHQLARARADSTIKWQDFLLHRFFRWLHDQGVHSLADVDHAVILQYQQYVSSLSNRKGRPYDPRVQNTHITAVRQLFRFLIIRNNVHSDPTLGIELASTPRTLPRSILTVEEVKRLLTQPDTTSWLGVRDRAMLEILYSTGVRRNELLGLDLSDLNPADGTIFVRRGKYRRDRVVPCGRIAWEWVTEYLQTERPDREPDSSEQAVFLSLKGSRLGPQGLKCCLDRYAAQAGFTKRVTPHTLRHSCATHMSNNGADIAHIQRILGHVRADTTAIYLHVAVSQLQKAHSRYHPREKKRGIQKRIAPDSTRRA